ncbi:MAG: HAMP domain-containing histidine kinase [Maribacter sp.]|nr:HAMP domain-containing histidine kinase [Maribacter sp.]
MKLISKLTLWYLIITAFVLSTSGLLTFLTVQHEMDEEVTLRLKRLTDNIAEQIADGIPLSAFTDPYISIKEIENSATKLPFQIIDTSDFYFYTENRERKLVAKVIYPINGRNYYVEASEFVVDKGEILGAVLQSLSWILMLFLLIMGLINRQVSKIILMPFKRLLQSIQSFDLSQGGQIELPETKVQEFSELNHFLKKMIAKALNDYRMLKEFAENSSHELQTPLSIIRGKLELLMESDINDEQARLILPAYDSIEKLSKINQALGLLLKIENNQFANMQPIDFSVLTDKVLSAFSELIELKSITLKKEIEDYVQLKIHVDLADILLSNLIKNAIRHNNNNGKIEVSLNSGQLIVKNTGSPPEVPVEQLFQRFKKSNQSSESIGLGLSIIKQICDLYKFKVEYDYIDQLHIIKIIFNGKD